MSTKRTPYDTYGNNPRIVRVQSRPIPSIPQEYHNAIRICQHELLGGVGKSADWNIITTSDSNVAFSNTDMINRTELPMPQEHHFGGGIAVPHPHDVLCGRGKSANNHPGNVHFRSMIKNVKVMYVSCRKRNKKDFSYAIVQSIRSMDPPGRFLKKDIKTNLWHDIGDKQALAKSRQALREGAPKVMEAIKLAREQNQKKTEQEVDSRTLSK